MTFEPARPAEPSQAVQTPIEPAEQTLEAVEKVIDAGRQELAEARSAALRAAETQEQRDAINARFDGLAEQFNTGVGRIEEAIKSGNQQLLDGLRGLMEQTQAQAAGSGATTDDDDGILSVEEIVEDATAAAGAAVDAATDGVAAAVDAAADAAEDVLPKRAHPLFRKLWGN